MLCAKYYNYGTLVQYQASRARANSYENARDKMVEYFQKMILCDISDTSKWMSRAVVG